MDTAREPRLSLQALRILNTLLGSAAELSGMDIRRETKIATGTLYPILMRLEEAGWLESRWEEVNPHEVGRPRRRLYRVTAVGARKARAACDQLGDARGRLAWS